MFIKQQFKINDSKTKYKLKLNKYDITLRASDIIRRV